MARLRIVALVAALLTICSLSAARNLVINGGFEAVDAESMPENWAAREWTVNVEADATTRGGPGSRCLAITVKAGKAVYGCFSRAMDVSGLDARWLLFSCRYRTLESPNVQAMVVSFADDFMHAQWETRPLATEARALRPSRRWQASAWHAELLPGTKQVVVVFQVLSQGTVMVDDVVLRPSPDEIKCEQLDVGRVVALPATRRASLRLVSRVAGVTKAKLTLTTFRKRRRAGRVAANIALDEGRPQDIDMRYSFPASEAHGVELAVTDGETGELLWFRRMDVAGLIDAQMETPAFRGTIMSTQDVPELVVTGRLFAAPAVLSRMKLSARLLGTGAEASEGKGITRLEEGAFRITLPTEGLLIGDHHVRIEAKVGAARAASCLLPVRRIRPAASEVAYDSAHRLWAAGRQVFPIGIYYVMSIEDLEVVKEAGFNLVVVPSPKASYVFADSAAAKGIGLVVASPSTRRQFWEMRQDKFGNHPALIAWSVLHRPDAKLVHPDVMLALYEILEEVSPNHPIATTLRYAETMSEYARATDIVIPWELPIPQLPITRIADVIHNARAATRGQKPIWALIQATGNAWATDRTMDEKAEGRLPTVAEVRALAYLALVHGADGLLFYAYNLIQSASERNYRITEDAPELWAGMCALNRELAALAVVVGAQSNRTLLPPAADGLVHMARWRQGDGTLIIAVNTAPLPTVTTFALPDCAARELEVMFEERKLATERPGAFGDSFKPYEVHVYATKKP